MAPVFTLPAFAATRNGTVAGAAVGRDRRAQVAQVHPEVGVDGHLAGAAEPEREGRLFQAGMPLVDMYMVSRGCPWSPSSLMSQPLTRAPQ